MSACSTSDSGRVEVWKVPSTPDDPSRGIAAGRRGRRSRRSAPTPARCRLFRPRHDRRDQRADPASRRADRADHHRRVSRPAGDRPAEASRPVRPAGRQAAGAGVARPAPGSAGTHASRRHGRDAAGRGGVPRGRARAARRRRARPSRSASSTASSAPRTRRPRARILAEEFPEAFACVSHEVAPEFREFERLSTAVVNAYLGPVMQGYIRRLGERLRGAGRARDAASDAIERRRDRLRRRRRGCRCAPSCPGPSTGVVGAQEVGRLAGYRRPDHLRHGRHLAPMSRCCRAANAGWPARRWCTAIRSRRRCWTSTRSAPAAARSPMSIAAAC